MLAIQTKFMLTTHGNKTHTHTHTQTANVIGNDNDSLHSLTAPAVPKHRTTCCCSPTWLRSLHFSLWGALPLRGSGAASRATVTKVMCQVHGQKQCSLCWCKRVWVPHMCLCVCVCLYVCHMKMYEITEGAMWLTSCHYCTMENFAFLRLNKIFNGVSF